MMMARHVRCQMAVRSHRLTNSEQTINTTSKKRLTCIFSLLCPSPRPLNCAPHSRIGPYSRHTVALSRPPNTGRHFAGRGPCIRHCQSEIAVHCSIPSDFRMSCFPPGLDQTTENTTAFTCTSNAVHNLLFAPCSTQDSGSRKGTLELSRRLGRLVESLRVGRYQRQSTCQLLLHCRVIATPSYSSFSKLIPHTLLDP